MRSLGRAASGAPYSSLATKCKFGRATSQACCLLSRPWRASAFGTPCSSRRHLQAYPWGRAPHRFCTTHSLSLASTGISFFSPSCQSFFSVWRSPRGGLRLQSGPCLRCSPSSHSLPRLLCCSHSGEQSRFFLVQPLT